MKPLILALQFMTRLPLPGIAADERDFAKAICWFPAAGIVVGFAVAAAAWLGVAHDPWTGALLALLAWVGITGALHLDGLGDIVDAAGAAHKDRSRISAVLSDPHIGSFGVVAIVLQLLAKLVLLHAAIIALPLWLLVVVPAIARMGPLVWTLVLPPLHAGLGTLFRPGLRVWHVVAWGAVALPACWFAPALLVAAPAFGLWASWISLRIGGISGDGHGAGIELVESTMLAALVLLA
jgi:adenosylcobinamide-GDP ribazoletransferase